jgi:hypothetical protein
MPGTWQKSSYDPNTAGDVLSPGEWQKSFKSEPNGGNCVEVNIGAAGVIGVRDSKLPDSPVFLFDNNEWDAFIHAVKAGQFDV